MIHAHVAMEHLGLERDYEDKEGVIMQGPIRKSPSSGSLWGSSCGSLNERAEYTRYKYHLLGSSNEKVSWLIRLKRYMSRPFSHGQQPLFSGNGD